MGITVGDVFTQFPNFKPEDMAKLAGTENYNGRTPISLTRIAHYNGSNAKELSVFVAGREKENYTKLLSENQRTQVNEQAGIKPESSDSESRKKSSAIPSHIPMNVSIFDINKKETA